MKIENPSKRYHTANHLVYSCQYHVIFYPKYRRPILKDKIKGYTSNILRKEFSELRRKLPTLWTHSKFISSVGAVTLEVVKKYIEEQKGK